MTDADSGEWSPQAYGDSYAERYDELMRSVPSEAADMISVLRDLNVHSLLEFGSGTGRLSIPLAQAGFSVTAIEASTRMIDVMRCKPGAEDVRLHRGDFSEMRLDTVFDGVLFSRNTLLALPAQRLQLMAIRNAVRHLTDNGRVFIDLGMPRPLDTPRFRYGGQVSDSIIFEQEIHDTVRQLADFTRIFIAPGSCSAVRTVSRYVWPAELDLMAALSGLRLLDRWSGWGRSAFTALSGAFVSTFGREL